MDRFARRLVGARTSLFGVGAILVLAALPFAGATDSDLSVQSLFAADDPRLVLYNRTAREFGGEASVLAVYRDPDALSAAGLTRLASIRQTLADVPYVASALCLSDLPHPHDPTLWKEVGDLFLGAMRDSWSGDDRRRLASLGAWRPKPLVDWFQTATPEAIAALKSTIASTELYRDAFVSADGTVVAVLLQLDRGAMASGAIEDTIDALRRVIETAPPEPGHLVGAPVMINDV
jgi:hypothetical protein